MMCLDLDHVDSELQHREIVGVLRRREIGDVAMNESSPGSRSTISLAGTRLSEQPIHSFRRLLTGQTLEEAGVRSISAPPRRDFSP